MILTCKNGLIIDDPGKSWNTIYSAKPRIMYDGHGIRPFTGEQLAKVRRHLEQSRANRSRYTKLLYWLDQHNDTIHAMTPAERYVLYHAIKAAPSVDTIRRQLYYLKKYAEEIAK